MKTSGPYGDRCVPRLGWYWRWGAPLIAGLGLLAAGALAAAASWGFDDAARILPPGEAAVAATAFAVALLLCWRIGRVDAKSLDDAWSGGRGETVAATLVAVAGVLLAAHYLDMPLRHDETRTILRAALPAAVTMSEYPTTNTHVLHTLLVGVAHRLAEWDRAVARAPAFLSFCVLLPLLWRFARREYGPTAAMFALVFGAASPYFIQYATNARGYTLMLTLFATALLCGQALIRTPDRKALWALWAAALGLGLFVLPIMVFPAAVAVAWLALARWRRSGRRGLRPFMTKTAAWSCAALATAAALYAPIVATEGARDLFDALSLTYMTSNGGLNTDTRALLLLAMPASLWRDWYEAFPAWSQGAMLALVVVGAAVPARSCGRAWTLLVALVVPPAVLLAPTLFPLPPRMAIWALLACVVLAGAGAGFVLERALAWAGSRWPSGAAGPRLLASRYVVFALAFVVSVAWATRQMAVHVDRSQPGLLAMASSVAAAARPGDWFYACDRIATRVEVHMRALYDVEEKARLWEPTPGRRSPESIHHLRAFAADPSPGASASPRVATGRSRLYFFEGWTRGGPRCRPGEPPAAPVLEANWPGYELAVAFDQGRVYVLDDWTDQPR